MPSPDAKGDTPAGALAEVMRPADPLLSWLERLLSTDDDDDDVRVSSVDDCLDGVLLTRALAKLDGEPVTAGGTIGAGDDTHAAAAAAMPGLHASLSHAGLARRCAPHVVAMSRGEAAGAHDLLRAVYKHYLANHAHRIHVASAKKAEEKEKKKAADEREEAHDIASVRLKDPETRWHAAGAAARLSVDFDSDGDDDDAPVDAPATGDGPEPSATPRPTADRASRRAAAARLALMEGPPLDPDAYVSEPHWAPPPARVDSARYGGAAASVAAFGGGDRDGGAGAATKLIGKVEIDVDVTEEGEGPVRAEEESPSAGTGAGGGFVASPAERRAAAAAAKSAVPDDDDKENDEATPSLYPSINPHGTHAFALELEGNKRLDRATAAARSAKISAKHATSDANSLASSRETSRAASVRASLNRSEASSAFPPLPPREDDDSEDEDARASRTLKEERAQMAIFEAAAARLEAEGERRLDVVEDASRRAKEAAEASSAIASTAASMEPSPAQSPARLPRASRGAAAGAAAASRSMDFSAARSSGESSSSRAAGGPPSGDTTISSMNFGGSSSWRGGKPLAGDSVIPEHARRSVLDRLSTLPIEADDDDEDEDVDADAEARLNREAASLRQSIASLRASLTISESGTSTRRMETDDEAEAADDAVAEEWERAGRLSMRSDEGESTATATATATAAASPGGGGGKKSVAAAAQEAALLAAAEAEAKDAEEAMLPSPPSESPEPSPAPSFRRVRGGDAAARMALDAKRRQIESEKTAKEKARGEQRQAAGREALMQFFASKGGLDVSPGRKKRTPTKPTVVGKELLLNRRRGGDSCPSPARQSAEKKRDEETKWIAKQAAEAAANAKRAAEEAAAAAQLAEDLAAAAAEAEEKEKETPTTPTPTKKSTSTRVEPPLPRVATYDVEKEREARALAAAERATKDAADAQDAVVRAAEAAARAAAFAAAPGPRPIPAIPPPPLPRAATLTPERARDAKAAAAAERAARERAALAEEALVREESRALLEAPGLDPTPAAGASSPSPPPRVARLGDPNLAREEKAKAAAARAERLQRAAEAAIAEAAAAAAEAAAFLNAPGPDPIPLRVAPRSLPRVARSPEEIAAEEDAKARREEAALRAAADAAFAAAAADAEAAMNAAAREAEAADAEAAGSGSPPPAFPEWFGAVDDDELLVDDDDAAGAGTAAVVDGFESGASNLLVPSDAARELEERDAWEERRRTEWERQDAEQREREAREKARAEAFKGLKGEAMWIDVGGWKRDADAGVPSGAWGRDALSKSGGVEPTLGHDAVTSRSLAAAAAERMARASEGAAAIDARRARSARAGGGRMSDGRRKTSDAAVVPAYRPSQRLSNKKIVRNALSHVCMAGAAMQKERDDALAALDAVPAEVAVVFVVLFRENTFPLKFRALYALTRDPENETVERLVKIHGKSGPNVVPLYNVDSTMKYDSGTREFKALNTSALTPLTTAITLARTAAR